MAPKEQGKAPGVFPPVLAGEPGAHQIAPVPCQPVNETAQITSASRPALLQSPCLLRVLLRVLKLFFQK